MPVERESPFISFTFLPYAGSVYFQFQKILHSNAHTEASLALSETNAMLRETGAVHIEANYSLYESCAMHEANTMKQIQCLMKSM